MKKILTAIGAVIAAYTYVYVTTLLVYYTNIPEVIENYWMDSNLIQVYLFTIILVVPLHFYYIYRAVKADKMEWAIAIPFFLIPYMLGVTAQAMVL